LRLFWAFITPHNPAKPRKTLHNAGRNTPTLGAAPRCFMSRNCPSVFNLVYAAHAPGRILLRHLAPASPWPRSSKHKPLSPKFDSKILNPIRLSAMAFYFFDRLGFGFANIKTISCRFVELNLILHRPSRTQIYWPFIS
jgi:hypothetical protein